MPSFDFHFDLESHNLRKENGDEVVRRGNEILESRIDSIAAEPNTGCWNDFPFYFELLSQPECVRVDLIQVIVKRSSYILGIQSVYRCTWRDGTTTKREGEWHDFEAGPYASFGGTPTVQRFALEPGEFLGQVETRQGAILDALVFVTNRRTEYIGGFGGHDLACRVKVLANTSDRRIVAFAGTYRGIMHRIGYYTKLEIRSALAILRRLSEQKRATAVAVPRKSFFGFIMQKLFTKSLSTGHDMIIQRLVAATAEDRLSEDSTTCVPENVFREIVEYL